MAANPIQFMREVKSEALKVTWPDLKSTRMLTVAVFILVTFISLFLTLADTLISVAVRKLIIG